MARQAAEHDVVIVGSGFAGLAAGIESLRAGARTVVVEKRGYTGGNSRISDAILAAAGTDEQARMGIDDTAELLVADMLEAGLGHNDEAWARRVAEGSADAFRWLADDIGCAFHPAVERFGGHSRPQCIGVVGGGKALVGSLETELRRLDGDVLTRHTAHRFVVHNGRVTAVEVEADGAPLTVAAALGVVVASGGYSSDVAFRMLHDNRLDSSVATTNLPGTTAQVMQAAMGIGAATRDLQWTQLGPWTSPDERAYGLAPLFTSFTAFPYGIIVDAATGRRFVNELSDRKVKADALLERGRPSLAIACEDSVTASGHPVDRAVRSGSVEAFDSIADLAARYGTDTEALTATIEDFNAAVARRHDPAFEKPILEGCPPLSPPFLAARLWPKTHYTMGGLMIDASAQVLDEHGTVIPGLFAAGEVTGGTHGACRLSSMATTECIVQGRQAGKAAATAG